MNNFNVIGRLTRDPESKHVGGKTVANFSIAVRHGKDDASFFDCVAWERAAENVMRLTKGSQAGFSGYLKQETWTDKNSGDKRSKVMLNVQQVSYVGSKADNGASKPTVSDDVWKDNGEPTPF